MQDTCRVCEVQDRLQRDPDCNHHARRYIAVLPSEVLKQEVEGPVNRQARFATSVGRVDTWRIPAAACTIRSLAAHNVGGLSISGRNRTENHAGPRSEKFLAQDSAKIIIERIRSKLPGIDCKSRTGLAVSTPEKMARF